MILDFWFFDNFIQIGFGRCFRSDLRKIVDFSVLAQVLSDLKIITGLKFLDNSTIDVIVKGRVKCHQLILFFYTLFVLLLASFILSAWGPNMHSSSESYSHATV